MSALPQNHDVRFTPESGHSAALSRCPLCAKNGLMHRNKVIVLFDHFVGAHKE
jgi:hypothetical protein